MNDKKMADLENSFFTHIRHYNRNIKNNKHKSIFWMIDYADKNVNSDVFLTKSVCFKV